jgi:16S rRNA processing protein RimM
MTENFVLGVLGSPFGLKGQLKFRPFSGENAPVLALKHITIRHAGEERRYTIEEATVSGAQVLLKFAGIDSPEAARLLSGGEILAGREEAAALAPGEYYIEDLRGMEVAALPEGGPAALNDPRLEPLGRVTDVIEGGSGQLLELRLVSTPASAGVDGAGELRLVPFRGEFFGEVSPERGRAVLLARWILE